jgi:hypothetical protein
MHELVKVLGPIGPAIITFGPLFIAFGVYNRIVLIPYRERRQRYKAATSRLYERIAAALERLENAAPPVFSPWRR